MRTSRLGCLTTSGIVTGLVTALAILGLTLARGGGLFSPGLLNAQPGEQQGGVTSHAELGDDCSRCHAAPWGTETMADRCTACHTDVAFQMREAASLHGAMNHKDPGLKCSHCHPDHRGADAALTLAGIGEFPHEELGYSLKGHPRTDKLQPFTCQDCHTDGIARFDVIVCADCHQRMDTAFTTAHETNWGQGCLECHDGLDTYGSDFDHSSYAFKLTGRHTAVSCYDCHPNAHSIADLQARQQACSDCHLAQDAHQGRFGMDCAGCHSASAWTDVVFDHAQSGFPLDGAHAGLECIKCHVNNQFSGTSSSCVSCHAEPVFHQGYFGTECSSCHSNSAWSPAKFDLDHPQPSVDEEGTGINHGRTGCLTCHPTTVSTYTCLVCHSDNQGGEVKGNDD